jgi:hypothetical protein
MSSIEMSSGLSSGKWEVKEPLEWVGAGFSQFS